MNSIHKIGLFLLIIITLIFAGCIESNDATNELNTATVEETPQNSDIITQINDDENFMNLLKSSRVLIVADFDGFFDSRSKKDYTTAEIYGSYLSQDCQDTLAKMQNYTLSPEVQKINDEYKLSLENYYQAGIYIQSYSNLNNSQIYELIDYINIGSAHKNRVYTLLDVSFDSSSSITDSISLNKWREVINFEGNGIKNTETFHISSDEWKIYWDTKPGQYGNMNFQIFVYNSNGALVSVAANVIGEDSDSSIMRGSGDYYLTINTGQPYEVIVEEKI